MLACFMISKIERFKEKQMLLKGKQIQVYDKDYQTIKKINRVIYVCFKMNDIKKIGLREVDI